jgi:hypothetical protein
MCTLMSCEEGAVAHSNAHVSMCAQSRGAAWGRGTPRGVLFAGALWKASTVAEHVRTPTSAADRTFWVPGRAVPVPDGVLAVTFWLPAVTFWVPLWVPTAAFWVPGVTLWLPAEIFWVRASCVC